MSFSAKVPIPSFEIICWIGEPTLFSIICPTVFPFPGRVGKTSILLRYVRGEYSDKQQSTLQASYLDKRLVAAGTPTHLSIWVRWWIVISEAHELCITYLIRLMYPICIPPTVSELISNCGLSSFDRIQQGKNGSTPSGQSTIVTQVIVARRTICLSPTFVVSSLLFLESLADERVSPPAVQMARSWCTTSPILSLSPKCRSG